MMLAHAAWGQAPPPVDAGRLLDQQRRTEPPARPAPGTVLPALPAAPSLVPQGQSDTQVTVSAFKLRGNTLVNGADLQAILAPWLGRPLGLSELRTAATALERAYRERGWLVQASLPRQDITDGVVQIDIAEARTDRVLVQPANPARPVASPLNALVQQLFDASLPEDQPLNLLKLERALLIADELPGARANGSLQAGAATGTTDVLVQLSPGPAYRTDISADNGGNRTTGDERLNLQLTVFAPWGRGEQFNLAGSVSRGSTYLRVAASMPVGFGGWAGWRAGVSASALQYQVLDAMNTTTGLAPRGSSQSVGVDLQYPLVRQVNSNWVFSTGYDIRRLRNEDDNQTLNLLEVTNQSTVRTLNAGVSGSHFDQTMGGGSTTASAFYTTGQTSLDSSPQAHMNSDGLTVNTEGSFQKLRWSVARNQSLGPSFSMLASASGQWASRNLDASEKFYLGGMNGVRAYPAGEAGGSTGQLATLELRRPLGDVLGNLLGGALGSKLGGQLTVAAFYDWGQVGLYQNNQRTDGTGTLVATNNVTLQGAGLSFNWRSHIGLDVRAIWARRIGSNPLETPAGTDTDGSLTRDRLWLSAYLTF